MEMPKDELLGYLNSRIYPNHGSSNKSKKFTGSVNKIRRYNSNSIFSNNCNLIFVQSLVSLIIFSQ